MAKKKGGKRNQLTRKTLYDVECLYKHCGRALLGQKVQRRGYGKLLLMENNKEVCLSRMCSDKDMKGC